MPVSDLLRSLALEAPHLGPRMLSKAVAREPGMVSVLLSHPLLKATLPLLAFAVAVPVLYLFFRRTWRELDREALRERGALLEEGLPDHRPLVAFLIMGFVLTLEEYYGNRATFQELVLPRLRASYEGGATWLKLPVYQDLYGFGWWSFAKVAGYALIPFPLWKLLFPKDSLLDLGLRIRGTRDHLWIYAVCLAAVLPLLFLVSREPDFGAYYPFYKLSSRSWFDFGTWELLYFVQFFCLELFFRGFILGTLRRSLGSAAIFAMAVPYCMIHYGKPYLESHGAILAGIVLGSLAMKTRSIYAGFFVHITVALGMDWISLANRHALPTTLFPPLAAAGCRSARASDVWGSAAWARTASVWRSVRRQRSGRSASTARGGASGAEFAPHAPTVWTALARRAGCRAPRRATASRASSPALRYPTKVKPSYDEVTLAAYFQPLSPELWNDPLVGPVLRELERTDPVLIAAVADVDRSQIRDALAETPVRRLAQASAVLADLTAWRRVAR